MIKFYIKRQNHWKYEINTDLNEILTCSLSKTPNTVDVATSNNACPTHIPVNSLRNRGVVLPINLSFAANVFFVTVSDVLEALSTLIFVVLTIFPYLSVPFTVFAILQYH